MEFSTATAWYLRWCEIKPSLEQLLEGKAEIMKRVRELSLTRDNDNLLTIQDLMGKKKLVADILTQYDQFIGRQEAAALSAAKEIVEQALTVVQEKLPAPKNLETVLDNKIKSWLNAERPEEKDCQLQDIFYIASLYREITTLAPTVRKKEFYCDITLLKYLVDEKLAEQWMGVYAQAADAKDIQRVKSDFEKEYLNPLEQQRWHLKQKYKNGFMSSPPEYKLLEAQPIAPFRQLQAEMVLVLSSPGQYLPEKHRLDRETQVVEKLIVALREANGTTIDYFTTLSHLCYHPFEFKDKDTSFLRENIQHYQQTVQRYLQLIAHKKQEARETLVTELQRKYGELEKTIPTVRLYHTYLSRVEQDLQEIKQKVGILGQNNVSIISSLEKRLVDLRQHPPYPEEEEKDILHVESLPPLTNAKEVWEYACEQQTHIRNKRLTNYCILISGMEDGRYDSRPLQLRLQEAKKVELLELNGKDRAVYERLHQAVMDS